MKLTDAEWALMNCVWQKHPATVREIADSLPKNREWAYTTIKTMLDRLVEKGVLSESKKGISSIYSPLVTKSAARASALKTLANHAFDGAFGPLVHFLIEDKKLSSREKRKLIEMLNKEDNK
jgi:BlaI family transcriptional regulator, penicillinase repressor